MWNGASAPPPPCAYRRVSPRCLLHQLQTGLWGAAGSEAEAAATERGAGAGAVFIASAAARISFWVMRPEVPLPTIAAKSVTPSLAAGLPGQRRDANAPAVRSRAAAAGDAAAGTDSAAAGAAAGAAVMRSPSLTDRRESLYRDVLPLLGHDFRSTPSRSL